MHANCILVDSTDRLPSRRILYESWLVSFQGLASV